MITDEQFETQFNKLSAAFGTTKSEKIMDQWYQEFQECDFKPFVDAMKRCQYGDRFPTWDVFRTQYKNCLGEPEVVKDGVGCDFCHNGRVFFWDHRLVKHDSDERVIAEVAANCGACSRDKIRNMASVSTEQFYRDKSGDLWSPRAYSEKQRVLKHNRNQI